MENIISSNLTSIFSDSNGSQVHCIQFPKDDTQTARNIRISSAAICTLISLVGITANGYVIWMSVYRLEKTFRSVLSMNLFITAFIWSLFLLLNIAYFASGINWPFGSFMCQLNNFMFHLNMFNTAFILTLYSIDYCFVVVWTMKYVVHRKPSLALVETLVFLIVAFCFGIPYFVFKTTYDCNGTIKCLDKLDKTEFTDIWRHGQKVIVIIAFILGYCIPFLTILLCFIIVSMVYYRKKSSKYTPALKLIFTFQTLFGACWLPYHILSFIKFSSLISGEKNLERGVEMVQPIIICLVSLGGAVSPIVYTFKAPDFKKKLPKYRK